MKKILSYLIVPAALFWGLVTGCYYDEVIPDVEVYTGAEVTWSGDIIPIFNASCNSAGCHAPGDVAPDLTSANGYNALVNGEYLNIQDPEQSELYQWVKGNRATTMPISGTDPQIVSAVLLWIQQGAQNN